jgi:hypothetical protein
VEVSRPLGTAPPLHDQTPEQHDLVDSPISMSIRTGPFVVIHDRPGATGTGP